MPMTCNMLSHFLAISLSLSLCVVTAPTLGVEFRNGVTYLAGNLFGRPAVDTAYDYVIVGGGTGGNAIAARLALDPAGYSVAVVEAGSFYEIYNSNQTQVPGYNFNYNLGATTSQVLFNLVTEPQVGYNGRTINYTVGKTFGGSSASNYMGYHRGTVGSFQSWADAVGDQDWNWEGVEPFFKMSTNFTPPNYDKIDPSFNISYDPAAFTPAGGPLQVSYGNHQAEYFNEISSAFETLGFPALAGLNSGTLMGYSTCTASIDPEAATRSSSETSYLQAAMQRSTIRIYPSTLGKRILFDSSKKATGVVVESTEQQNTTFTLSAKKEVIVSAGTWHSPQLLMVSGVGPEAILKQHNIPIISALEGVGQNEWDQPWLSLSFKVNKTTKTQILLDNPTYHRPAIEEYLTNQSGPLSGIGGAEAIGWEKFGAANRARLSSSTLEFLSTFPDDWPEVEYLPLAVAPTPANVSSTDQYLLLGAALLATSSRGNVTIRSGDTADPPIINPNLLLDEGDAEQAVQAFLRTREIAAASNMVIEEFLPGRSVQTDEEILEWLRANMTIIYHASCSCAMGSDDDPLAVLDSHARVRGTMGLRVVDASSFPSCPPGHPQSAVYMFAEKIAHYILNGE